MVVLRAVEAATYGRAALSLEASSLKHRVYHSHSRVGKARSGSEKKASAITRETEVLTGGTSIGARNDRKVFLATPEQFRQVRKQRNLISRVLKVDKAVAVSDVNRPQSDNGSVYRRDHCPQEEVLGLERESFDDGDPSDTALQFDGLACDELEKLSEVCAISGLQSSLVDGHSLTLDQDGSLQEEDGSSIVLKNPLSIAVFEEAFPIARPGLNGLVTTKKVVDEALCRNEKEHYVEVPGNCSFWQAMLNSVNILLGVGLLSIPYAMSQGGWSALGVLFLLGIATNYTGKILGQCQSRMCLVRGPSTAGVLERGLKTYEDIGEAAFGEFGRQLITGVLYTELVGTCGLFFILEGDNLATLFGGDPKTYMIASALVLVPTTWLPDLSALAGLGALGAMASVSVLGVLMYSFITGGLPEGPGTTLLHLHTLPLTFGILAFVYAGHAVFPNIQASMKNPEEYPKMLDFTYVTVGVVCALVGAVGYHMFGDKALEEITLNLPAGHLATIATSLIIINPFTKFALTMEPVAQGLERAMGLRRQSGPSAAASASGDAVMTGGGGGKREEDGNGAGAVVMGGATRIMGRAALGGVALFLATSVPFFGGVMALVGSCLTLGVSVIFPSAAYLSLFGGQISLREKAWNYFVISLGIFCAAAGTVSALESLNSGSGSHLL